MLGVMIVIACLYVSAGVRLLSSWRESRRDRSQVHSLEAQNHKLQRQHDELASPGTVQAEARRLGMIHPGEQTYVVSDLPSN
jgi:cell division protein FtsB